MECLGSHTFRGYIFGLSILGRDHHQCVLVLLRRPNELNHWKNQILNDVRFARSTLTQQQQMKDTSVLRRQFLLFSVHSVQNRPKAQHENMLILVESSAFWKIFDHIFQHVGRLRIDCLISEASTITRQPWQQRFQTFASQKFLFLLFTRRRFDRVHCLDLVPHAKIQLFSLILAVLVFQIFITSHRHVPKQIRTKQNLLQNQTRRKNTSSFQRFTVVKVDTFSHNWPYEEKLKNATKTKRTNL